MIGVKGNISSSKNDIRDILRRIRTRDFSGNTGIAVKNSIYKFLEVLFAKGGSLIFTIILARILMPELFGLYSLALSTILIFSAISESGISDAVIRFVSKSIGEKKFIKSRNYISHLGKIKFIFTLLSIFLLLTLSKYVSTVYYQKPIFLALIAGGLYILFAQTTGFFIAIVNSFNNFKDTLIKEIIFQSSRLILVPLAVVYILKSSLSNETVLLYVISLLAVSYFISGAYLLGRIKKKKYLVPKSKDLSYSKEKLSSKEKKEVNRFVILTYAIVLSGVFFGNIDKIMLGGFVSAEFIGYYQAAFGLISALTSLGAFSTVLLPIFSRIQGKRLENAMKKSLKIILLLSSAIFLLTLLFSHVIIFLVYGKDYLLATNILRLFSILIIIIPITNIYITYFMSESKPGIVTSSLVISTLINVLLNYILIVSLLRYGEIFAVYGAAIATVVSKFIYFGILVIRRNKKRQNPESKIND